MQHIVYYHFTLIGGPCACLIQDVTLAKINVEMQLKCFGGNIDWLRHSYVWGEKKVLL